MILEKVKKTSAFLDFFQEADDDETPKRNQKVIKVRAPGGRRTDFTQGADLADDEAEEPVPEEPATDDTDFTDADGSDDTGDTGSDAGADDELISDDTDFTDDSGDEENIDAGDPAADGTGADEPVSDDTDFTDDDASDDMGNDSGDSEGDSSGDEPVTDDTDFSDDSAADDSGEEDSSTDDGTDDSGDGEKPSDEQIRKYSLYKKFTRLNETLDTICDSLSSMMSDNSEINQKYKTVAQKLKELNQLLSEYMILKFTSASYIQSMLFYQRSLAIVDINLNILKDLKKEITKTKNMNK